MSVASRVDRLDLDVGRRGLAALSALGLLLLLVVAGLLFPESFAGTLLGIVFAKGTLASALRLSVPITLAALGGIFSEKSGVINIGLEGLLIISAFSAVYAMDVWNDLWIAFLAGVLASVQFQLVAYHAAKRRGRSIDKPRNLAKSVTVE
jgi:simple sugar transport system permease protein